MSHIRLLLPKLFILNLNYTDTSHFFALGNALKCNKCFYNSKDPKENQKCDPEEMQNCTGGTSYCFTSAYTDGNGTSLLRDFVTTSKT